jgi:GxxExxY protein
MIEDPLGQSIIGAAMAVHRSLGPGLLESTYQRCLEYELRSAGFSLIVEPYLAFTYKGLRIERAFKPDLIVEHAMIVEIKHIEKILSIHEAQTRTYMKLTGVKSGLIFNFNTQVLKNGIRRLDLP